MFAATLLAWQGLMGSTVWGTLALCIPLILFWNLFTERLYWYHVAAYSCLTVGGQFACIAAGAAQLAEGSLAERWCLPFVYLFFFCIAAFIWWKITHVIAQRMSQLAGPVGGRIIWMGAYWGYYCVVLYYAAGSHGCLLVNPLLVAFPAFWWPVAYLGTTGTLFVWCAISALIAYFLEKRRLRTASCALIGLIFIWGGGAVVVSLLCQQEQPSAWLKTVGVVQQHFSIRNGYTDAADQIAAAITALRTQYPEVRLCIFPESSIPDPLLHDSEQLRSRWMKSCNETRNKAQTELALLIGTFRWRAGIYCATALLISGNGRKDHFFDKRRPLMFTERLPGCCDIPFFRDRYFATMPIVMAGTNVRPLWNLDIGCSIVPYICSEFFTARLPDDPFARSPILLLCNDRWALPVVQRWLRLVARYRAVEWQRSVLFISYAAAELYTVAGNVFVVKSKI